jgi:DNA-binding beta-propeller fold protein YncE
VLLGDTGSVAYVGQGLTVERSRRVADSLSALRHMPDGKHLVAIEPQSHNLLYLDAATFKVTQRRRLHETPNAIDVSHDGELIVCTSENGAVNLLNPSTGEWRHAELKPPLSAVLFRYDGKMILTANPDQRILTALRVPDLAVIAELPLAMRPDNLCFTPDGGQLFVSGEGMDAVAIVFPYDALDVDQTVLVGREPGAMACSDSPAYLFVGSSHETNVSIMRVDTRKPVGAVDVGCRPTYLTLTPDGQYALVLCQDSGYLAVIRVGAIRAMRSKMGVALFTMLPVGEKPRQCAFVPKQLA